MPRRRAKIRARVRTRRKLMCALTDEQVAAKDAAVDRLSGRVRLLSVEMRALKARVRALRKQIRERAEARQVPCEVLAKWKEGEIEVRRLDTGEVVSSKKLSTARITERMRRAAKSRK